MQALPASSAQRLSARTFGSADEKRSGAVVPCAQAQWPLSEITQTLGVGSLRTYARISACRWSLRKGMRGPSGDGAVATIAGAGAGAGRGATRAGTGAGAGSGGSGVAVGGGSSGRGGGAGRGAGPGAGTGSVSAGMGVVGTWVGRGGPSLAVARDGGGTGDTGMGRPCTRARGRPGRK